MGLVGQDHRKQEFIPGLGELPDDHHREAGRGEREHDMAVQAHQAGAVDPPGFEDLGGDAGVIIAEDQGGDGNAVDDMHQHQPGQIAVQLDGLHELHQRDQDALVGDEHAEQDQREDQVRAAEFPFGQQVAVQRTQQSRKKRLRDHHHQAVADVGRKLFVTRQ